MKTIIRLMDYMDIDEDFVKLINQWYPEEKYTVEQMVDWWKNAVLSKTHIVYVAEDTDSHKIVGITLGLIHFTFLHGSSKIMHHEDMLVHEDYRGMGIAKQLTLHLAGMAKQLGCYKMICAANEKNANTYKKYGYNITNEKECRMDL